MAARQVQTRQVQTRTRRYRCVHCGEYRQRALHDGEDICRNCANREMAETIPLCGCCGKENVPGQFHHIAHKRYCDWFGVDACLSCHAIFTFRQVKFWPKNRSNIFYIIQGTYDYISLTRRSFDWNVDNLLHGQIGFSHWRAHINIPLVSILDVLHQAFRACIQSIGFVPFHESDY